MFEKAGYMYPPCLCTSRVDTHMPLPYLSTHARVRVRLVTGDIDFSEFKQMVYDGLLLEGAIQDYEDAFNAVDNSGNGSIGEQQQQQQ